MPSVWCASVLKCTDVVNHSGYSNRYTFVSVLCTLEHSHHLVLIIDIGSCLQQSLDYLGVSLMSSYHQRNTAMLYESMRDKRTVIASEDHCCRTEQRESRTEEREREFGEEN